MLSIQTNVASLVAQNNIRINTEFQSNTINQLSSGYRINSSADDAAGLAVANQYQGQITTLTQGVMNANNSIGQLQIVDGGMTNISNILDRMQTLATESASSTFVGNRTTLNNEYQGLLSEINRQASNINLNTGGTSNTNLITYTGGGNNAANSQVSVNLSGANNAVDSTGLGISSTNVQGGGTELTGNNVNLNNTAVQFLTGGTQSFSFNIGTSAGNQAVTVSVAGGATGLSGTSVINSLNSQLQTYGINASIAGDGTLQFGGPTAFTVAAGNASAGTAIAVNTSSAVNTGDYNLDSSTGAGAAAFAAFTTGGGTTASETVVFQNAGGTKTVTLDNTNASSLSQTLSTLNSALGSIGISAVQSTAGNVSFQSVNAFSVNETAYTAGANGGTGNLFGGTGAVTVTGPAATASSTGSAISALSLLSTAINNLGLTQGTVGAGINKLNYAVNLAQSQVTNYSAAESGIRDADVAQEAANLTKAQVLQQASLAALAQANSAPQAVLALLSGH